MKEKVHCPNTCCEFFKGASSRFYIKKGYYVTQWNHQKVPRYECRGCRKRFSSHTFYRTYKQKKPYLNETIFKLYCSATTQRRIATILKINRKTVVRKFLFLAQNSQLEHSKRIEVKAFKVTEVQFDEMLSFEHTRLRPLSIALAVEKKSYQVLDIGVAQSHYQGRLSSIALKKYGPREDKSYEAREKVFKTLNSLVQSTCHIITDAKPHYRTEIKNHIPRATLSQVKNRGNRLAQLLKAKRQNKEDSMFELNLIAARIRHDLSRMARKVWVTTKKAENLQRHLMLFVAYQNGYPIAV